MADTGSFLAGTFRRRLLEVLFDGKPEAMESLLSAAKQWKANVAKGRERLVVPADPDAAAKLATRYHNAALGGIAVSTVERVDCVRLWRVEERRGLAEERRRDDVIRHHRSRVWRLRVRRQRQLARAPRQSARVRVHAAVVVNVLERGGAALRTAAGQDAQHRWDSPSGLSSRPG